MANNVQELTRNEFDGFIKEGLTLVDFFADWCMPCIMMGPVIEELGGKFTGKIKFGKINVDDNNDIAGRFRVASIPNFILFKNGQVLDRFVGAMPVEDFEEKLKEHL